MEGIRQHCFSTLPSWIPLAFLMSLFFVGQKYVSGNELTLLFFFLQYECAYSFIFLRKHLCLLRAKSYVWKALGDFKQTSDMIFLTLEFET